MGGALLVEFAGRDGRRKTFDFAELKIGGLRADLAAAFSVRIGHAGTLNTLTSANNAWYALKRFVDFLSGLRQPPAVVEQLTASHLRGFRLYRLRTCGEVALMAEMRRVCRVLAELPADRLNAATRAQLQAAQVSTGATGHEGVAGYSDAVFTEIMRAARSDVAAIRDRIRAGEALLARARSGQLDAGERDRAAGLLELAATGEVPMLRWPGTDNPHAHDRIRHAGRLFLTSADLAPLIVLGIGLSGRNGETIKELPVQYELLDGRAVHLRAVKRRRGAGHWYADVVWEIGAPSRQLHTPGGFYLLLLELTARSRAFSRSATVWSVWLGGSVRQGLEGGGHLDPFAATLSRDLGLSRWARGHGLTEDGKPLSLTANRIKTTVERRRTFAVGGHLPSAVRTNTQDVLFASYLAGDPTVRDWADDLVGEAITDAEQTARDAHRRALDAGGGHVAVVGDAGPDSTATGFAACVDTTDGPFNTGPCRASFLACFACRNALVTAEHLPALLDLQTEVERRWDTTPSRRWWQRYGQAWLAITEDVLPRFTPDEIEAARQAAKPSASALLELLEGLHDTE
ncbi:hypothetical protein ACIA59_24165 [Micromonospora haikouensis]|uniref:hypothetical protein n=1 Tax=Micromonospora haikouensis TaxID=686309 RepID=UPI0037BA54A9